MVGGTGTGFAHAVAELYSGGRVWLVRGPGGGPAPMAALSAFWETLGALPIEISAQEHDESMAWVSHLPQLTSTALALNWQGWIFALISDSVAINTGTNTGCPPTDQLGYPRPQDGEGDGIASCDVGSHEFSRMKVRIYLPLVLK